MLFLILALMSLVVAPFIRGVIHQFSTAYGVAETAIFFLVIGLVVMQILPDALQHSGWVVLVIFLVGWLGPNLGEAISRKHARSVHSFSLIISVGGIAFHEIMDGVSLSYAASGDLGGHFGQFGFHVHPLPLAVVLHRFPSSIFIWWLLQPRIGYRLAILSMVGLGFLLLFGYFFGTYLLNALQGTSFLGYLEAWAAGSLMHIASHQAIKDDHHHDHHHPI